MNPEVTLTPEQQQQMNSWVAQRDTILKEISDVRTESDKQRAINVNLTQTATELDDKINQSIGRLQELDKKEEDRAVLIRADIVGLSTEKSTLQTEVSSLKTEISLLTPQKESLVIDIKNATDNYEKIVGKVTTLDQVIEHVTKVNAENIREVNSLVVTLKASVKEILDMDASIVEKANYIISELPRIFFAMQRQVPVKQTTTLP